MVVATALVGEFAYTRALDEKVEQHYLAEVVDYCSDAAVQDMLNSADLSMDYMNVNYLEVDPTIALQAFVDNYLKCYDMALTTDNRYNVMLNYMPAFCVAAFDGYYLATVEKVTSSGPRSNGTQGYTGYNLVFTQKMPYTYTPDNSTQKTYALNLEGEYYYEVDGSLLSKRTGYPIGITCREDLLNVINTKVSDSINYAIAERNKSDEVWANTFYIPTQLTAVRAVNPIQGVSVLALVQNVETPSGREVSTFSVAGSKIKAIRMVVCYQRNGQKYYCYADKLPAGGGGVTIEEICNTMKEAAEKGYQYDPVWGVQ